MGSLTPRGREGWGLQPQPKHGMANCSQTVSAATWWIQTRSWVDLPQWFRFLPNCFGPRWLLATQSCVFSKSPDTAYAVSDFVTSPFSVDIYPIFLTYIVKIFHYYHLLLLLSYLCCIAAMWKSWFGFPTWSHNVSWHMAPNSWLLERWGRCCLDTFELFLLCGVWQATWRSCWGDWKCTTCQMQNHENSGPNRRAGNCKRWIMMDQITGLENAGPCHFSSSDTWLSKV